MSEAAADDFTVEEELELQDILDEEDKPDHDDQVPDEEDLKPAKKAAAAAAEETPAQLRARLAALEAKNQQLSGWAGRTRHDNQELAKRIAKSEDRLERMLRAMAEAQGVDVADLDTDPADRVPDPDTDIAGHITQTIRREIAGLKGELAEGKAKEEAAQDLDRMIGRVHEYHETDIAAFEAQHPDYDAAEGYLVDSVYQGQVAALRDQHPRADSAWLAQQAQAAVLDLIARYQIQYAHDGASLAEYVYQEATRRGYRGNGAAPPARKRGAADLKERRQRAGTSLAAVSGAAGTGGKRIDQLLDLSDDDFDAAIEGKDFKRIAAQLEGA